jgi:hypothetical protein
MDRSVSTLSDDEVNQIRTAYYSNESLHGAYYLKNRYNRLTDFMKRCTGKEFEIDGKKLAIKKEVVGKKQSDMEDEIPF